MSDSRENNDPHNSAVKYGKAFAFGIALNILFVVVEVIFGIAANSSALLADAGHNASDVLGLLFAWIAAWLATLKPTGKYSYGYRKTTILVSILNAVLLFGAVAIIAWESLRKFKNPDPVEGTLMMLVAGVGVIINTITALLFYKGQHTDLNIRGAFLHMAADAAISLGVVIAGLMINLTGLYWIDPVVSMIIVAVIFWGTWHLFADSVNLALDAVPKHISIDEVKNHLLSKTGVKAVSDLHIWAVSTTQVALTAHLIIPDGTDSDFIAELNKEMKEKFNIVHTTFQIERNNQNPECKLIQ